MEDLQKLYAIKGELVTKSEILNNKLKDVNKKIQSLIQAEMAMQNSESSVEDKQNKKKK